MIDMMDGMNYAPFGASLNANQKLILAGVYCRLSKEDGDKEESDSIAHQRDMLTDYCRKQGWQIYSVYQDDGYSGLNQDRPDFQRLLQDVRDKKINLVITKDYSRLGRNHIETSRLTEEFFPRNGVRYIALNDGIDTEQENEIMPFKALLNEMYSKDVSKKVHSAYYLQATKGVYTGCVPPFGYLKDPMQKGHLIIDPETAPIVENIFELAELGWGTAYIRHSLENDKVPCPAWWNRERGFRNHTTKWEKKDPENGRYIWDESVLKDMLINPVYYGAISSQKRYYRFKLGVLGEKQPEEWIVVENCHEPIVDKETFLLVQERLKSRKKADCKGKTSIFAGLLKCGECGKSLCLTYENSKEKPKIYNCKTYNRYGSQHCTRHKIRYDTLTQLVQNQIQTLGKAALQNSDGVLETLKAQNEAAMKRHNTELKKEISKAEKRIKVLDKVVTRLYSDLAEERISDDNFLSMMDKTQKEQEDLKKRVKRLRAELEAVEVSEDNDEEWVRLIAEYSDIQELDAETLNKLIKKIVLHEQNGKKRLEIHFNLKSCPELHSLT